MTLWMCRCDQGRNFADFVGGGFVSLGWHTEADPRAMDRDELRAAIAEATPTMRESLVAAGAAMVSRFAALPEPGDDVLTYHPPSRRYAVGEIVSDYIHDRALHMPNARKRHSHMRRVIWRGLLPREALPETARNALQPTISFFRVRPEAERAILQAFETHGEPLPARA